MKSVPNMAFLRYFYSAATSKSISKAANENFVSQSAISQAIAKLEISLGKPLITHEKNRFQLTQEGHLLLDKCKTIFGILTEIDDLFNNDEGSFRGRLSFACTHSFALSLLPPHLGKLSQQWPQIEPILRLGHTGIIKELVKSHEVDFGIVLDNDDFSAFQVTEVFKGEYQLYKAKKTSKMLPKRFIMSEERKEIALLKQQLRALHNMEIDSCIEVSSWEVIATLVEQGLGIGFLPDYVAAKHKLITYEHPIKNISYCIVAISPKNQYLSRNARMFIETLLAL